MQHLPVNLVIRNHILVFGCGNVGSRKAKFLADLGFRVIAVDSNPPEIDHPNIEIKSCLLTEENFMEFLEVRPDLVVVAIAEERLSKRISDRCQIEGLPVNVVDIPEMSTVTFSSIIKSGYLSFAISTQGSCPFFAKVLRKELTSLVKERARQLDVLATLRKESLNPKKDLQLIYQDESVQRSFQLMDVESALRRGREILREIQ